MSGATAQSSGMGPGFLKFNRFGGFQTWRWTNAEIYSLPPRLHITSDDPEFDPELLSHWKEEGFDVTYFPYDGNQKAYKQKLAHLADDIELGESYALIGKLFWNRRIRFGRW